MTILSPYIDVNKIPNCLKQLSQFHFDGTVILVALPAGTYDHRTGTVFDGKDHDISFCKSYVVRGREKIDDTSLQRYLDDHFGCTIFLQPDRQNDSIYRVITSYPSHHHIEKGKEAFFINRIEPLCV